MSNRIFVRLAGALVSPKRSGLVGSEGAGRLLGEGGTSRRSAIEELMKSVGGKLEAFYFSFGESDVVALADAPSHADASAAALAVDAGGGARVTTTVLLTPGEIDEAASRSASYTPPGGLAPNWRRESDADAARLAGVSGARHRGAG